ncbi:hypothetical protein [Pseudomonas pseudonitroreducens]|uniref:hypothetical protein n=1 Tax=Pseudomonas pseudonitroreducens TaxID=2892326 RepID=UPI001F368BC7|nr:hypothetical protein [Pseudomonas pseudonitroreducens]
MSRRVTSKVIHYVRATYNKNTAPQQTLEQLIRSAMRKLGSMEQTEVALTLGTVVVRHRRKTNDEPLMLDIGAGVPGEQMTTLGLKVKAEEDVDQATLPPRNRAFKHSEAFVLIDGNDLLVITEGSFRIATVGVYLAQLISKGELRSGDVAFELRKVTNQETKEILEKEGIKELRLKTNMYRATQVLDGGTQPATVSNKLRSFVGVIKDLFAQDIDENKREQMAQHWDEIQVNTVIKADGGSRAEEIVLEVMNSVGTDVLEEEDDTIEVTVVTKKDTEIRLGQVTPTKKVKLLRREGANDLINTEAYGSLDAYRAELIKQKLWQR